MCNTPVFAQQAELHLPLGDDRLVLWPQAAGMTGEYEGVAVQAGAIIVNDSA